MFCDEMAFWFLKLHILYVRRHIVTVGQCICDKEPDHEDSFLCRVPFDTANQNTDSNTIDIFAEDKSNSEMMNGESYNWEATEAYILEGSKLKIKTWNVDIGMAIVSADKPFFNRVSLNQAGELELSLIHISEPTRPY